MSSLRELGSRLRAPGSGLFPVLALVACSSLKQISGGEEAGSDAASVDASATIDSALDASASPDADAGVDASKPVGPTGLDSELAVAPLDAGPPCSEPGNDGQCFNVASCRFATPDSGVCEPCPVGACKQLIGKTCAKSNDCDSLLECYKGTCTLVCRFPDQGQCGGVRKCLDIGFLGPFGVCDANPPY